MSYGIRLHVWGERACFTRPEMKVERVSYDVMTPSAARGILEAVLWKPQIRWIVDRIHVLRPIRFQSFRRNEVGAKVSAVNAERAMRAGSTAGLGLVVEEHRQQRATTLLVDVGYVIEARFALTGKAGPEDTPAKYLGMFNRRAAAGQCFHRPCLGTREFPADFALLAGDAPLPASTLPAADRDKDFGWMLHDIDFENGHMSRFFRARLTDGVLDVARCLADGVAMMDRDRLFAHSLPGRPTAEWESLAEHSDAVSQLAVRFASPFGWGAMGAAVGLLHDAGKASAEFQSYIRAERARGEDHSTWGARLAEGLYGGAYGRILAYCIAGHHAGLSDAEDLRCRLDPARREIPDAARWSQSITPPAKDTLRPTRAARLPGPGRDVSFGQAFLIRMLFSCLVDADFLATERFISGASVARGVDVELGELRARLHAHLDTMRSTATRLNRLRAEILDHATGKANEESGFFTLTVPTGGGKTLTSLAFALDHACLKHKRRIVYVVPFTAIIEQTAAIFRNILGDAVVLEHHSSFDWEAAEKHADPDGGDDRDGLGPLRRAAENWDAPVIVTTAVQFFESLFASRTSRCRKLHNLVDSVIVLDEAQTLPTNLLLPCLAALEELATNYGATIVLCTATQPAVRQQDAALIDRKTGINHGLAIASDRELAPRPQKLYRELRRVHVEIRGGTTGDDVIAARFAEQPQMLCIVASRRHARELFEQIADEEGAVHLTTCMCPAHRREVLADLRERLTAHRPVRLVATSLIEAGVDISFPEVWRARAGVDQIAQAAGRCNRDGELLPALGRIVVFEPADHRPPRVLTASLQAAAGVLRDHEGDPLGLDCVAAYFRHLYFQKGFKALDRAIVENQPGILAALRRNANGLGFPFRSIADAFRMIDEAMTPVVVPWNDEAKTVLNRLGAPKCVPCREDLRKLQQFTVGIPKKARDEWLLGGEIRPVCAAFGEALLRFTDDSLYRPRSGIDLGHPSYREAESNVF